MSRAVRPPRVAVRPLEIGPTSVLGGPTAPDDEQENQQNQPDNPKLKSV